MKKEIKCRVTGKVQMVLYRDFVQRKARALGIKGTVENMDDGSVQVMAQGDEDSLRRLIEHLHKGPFNARVARVDAVWDEPKEEFTEFKILY